ncbi:hypothetical protein ACFLYD_04800 [Chloroflexota bacterium]
MRFKGGSIAASLSLGFMIIMLVVLGFSNGPIRAQTGEEVAHEAPEGGEAALLPITASRDGGNAVDPGLEIHIAGRVGGPGHGLSSLRKTPTLVERRPFSPVGPASPLAGIANGGFENGPDGSWLEYSEQGWALILNEEVLLAPPHGGSWATWLGGDFDEISLIEQVVDLPAQNAVLTFWLWIASEDQCGKDYGVLAVDDATATFDLCTAMNTEGWALLTADLADFAGQTVTLMIAAVTDDSLNSNLFVDDVSLGGGPTGLFQVYAPLGMREWSSGGQVPFAPPCSPSNNYCEPFNTWKNAYGPLEKGVAYRAYPNDHNDYYYINVDSPSSLTVRVTNYAAVGQLLVRNESLQEIAKDFNTPPTADGNMTVPLPGLQPGKYYIQLFTSGGQNESTLYTLTVTQ